MSLAGAFTGVLGLAGLEVLLSSPRASGALGSVATGAGAAVNRIINPKVGLIPNFRDTSAPLASTVQHPATPAEVAAVGTRAAPGVRTVGISKPPIPTKTTVKTPAPVSSASK
jgi:hypothetical protein